MNQLRWAVSAAGKAVAMLGTAGGTGIGKVIRISRWAFGIFSGGANSRLQNLTTIATLVLSLAIVSPKLAAPKLAAQESYPVVHREPITLRVLSGKGQGAPVARVHLTLIGGYDADDLKREMWRETILTNEHGEVRLPSQMANLPLLQVRVQKLPLCQWHPHSQSFSVERIRVSGESAPNLCGTVTADETPGVFTVFVRKRPPHPDKKLTAFTPGTPPGIHSAATFPTRFPATLPATSSTPSPSAQDRALLRDSENAQNSETPPSTSASLHREASAEIVPLGNPPALNPPVQNASVLNPVLTNASLHRTSSSPRRHHSASPNEVQVPASTAISAIPATRPEHTSRPMRSDLGIEDR